jgi:microcystin degradation protein MlrC
VRVLTGSLIQESNTFSPSKSDLSFFEAGCLLFDDESLRGMTGKRTELSGFIAASARRGAELAPTLAAWASSGGPITTRDFDRLADDLLRRARAAGPVDGVLLALHGAWVSEAQEDADGWLIQQLREIVGPNVPIVVTLDLHANVTARMVDAADALVGFRTYPHVDMYETGDRGAEVLFRILDGRSRPSMAYCKIPMIVPPENAQTTDGPMSELMDAARELEALAGGLSASVFSVQPWLDVSELGCSIVVVSDDAARAQVQADRLGRMAWERRHRFNVPLVSPEEAVARALTAAAGPILLVDSADGVSSGAPGDSTALLAALARARPERPVLITVVDPEAARAVAAADGQTVSLAVGGALDPARHRPVPLTGIAHRVPRSRVTFTAGVGDGLDADMGAAAILEVAALRVLLMEKPVPCYDPALYRTAGLEPSAAQAVVVKSPNNFRWTYRGIAREWIYVDAPGASTPRLGSLVFRRAPRPLFPLDDWAWLPGESRPHSVEEQSR